MITFMKRRIPTHPQPMTIRRLTVAVTLTSFLVFSPMSRADINLGVTPPPTEKKKGDCDEDEGTTNSFDWYVRVGSAFYPATENLLTNFRFSVARGQNLGANPPTLDDVMKGAYGRGVINRFDVILQMETPEISAANLSPASITYNTGIAVETVKTGDTLRQMVTETTFVNILPQTVGFKVSVYDIAYKSAAKTAGLYTLTAAIDPTYEVIMTTDDGGAYDGTLQMITIDRRGSGSRVKFKRFITNTTTDVVTEETYTGSLTGTNPTIGIKVEEVIATFSNRGAKPFDYTLVKETKRATVNPAANPIYGSLVTISKTLDQYQDFTIASSGGDSKYKRLLKHIDGYGSTEPRETVYTWYNLPSNEHIHGRLKSVVKPDRNWEYYEYTDSPNSSVAQETKYESWLNILYGSAGYLTNSKKTVTSVTGAGAYTRTVTIAGQMVSQEKKTFASISGGKTLKTEKKIGIEWQTETIAYHSQSAANLVAGRPRWTQHQDGTFTTYAYSTVSGNLQVTQDVGAGTSSAVTSGTRTITRFNKFEEKISEEVRDIASGLVLKSWVATTTDTIGRPTTIVYNANLDDYETFDYQCCGLAARRNRDASVDNFTYDAFKRVISRTHRRFAGDTSPVYTGTNFNGLTTTISKGGLLVNSKVFKLNGEIDSFQSPDANGNAITETTTYSYSYPSAGGSIMTVTHPDGGTEITTRFADGRLMSKTGTAVPDRQYEYGTHVLNGGGTFTKVIKLTGAAATAEWEKTYLNTLGRAIRVEYPSDLDQNSELDAFTGSYYSMAAALGNRGKLQTVVNPDGVNISYSYDGEGRLSTMTKSMPDSQSQITNYLNDVINDGTVGVSQRKRISVNNLLVSTELASGDGYAKQVNVLGKTTTKVRSVSNTVGNATMSHTQPDGTGRVDTIVGNLVTKQAWLDTADNELWSTTYTYDALERVISQTDSRTGTTSYMMSSAGTPVEVAIAGAVPAYTESGNLIGQRDSGGRVTIYTYDVMGRQTSVNAPDTTDSTGATLDNITYTSYYPTGQIKASWGGQTNATFHLYDEQGRMTELRTYRNLAHGAEPVVGTTGYDATTWEYDPERGFLSQKRDSANAGANYIYTPAGRLTTRLWARSVGGSRLSSTYSYDAGMLSGIDYSDATPDVTIGYDAFGRRTEVLQADQSKIEYTYDPTTMAVDEETVSYDLDHDGVFEFSRVIDRRALDSAGREKGWELKAGATVENEVDYGYNPITGTMQTVDAGTHGTFSYHYETPTPKLVGSVTSPVHQATNHWKTDRDVLESKQNEFGTVMISQYDYQVNALGQRTGVESSGGAFSGSSTWGWGYNAGGEVVKADSSVSAYDRAYQYDAIGNRKKASNSLTLPVYDNYAVNSRNQYTVIGSISPMYDLDGNATSYPLPASPTSSSGLVWDAENRLIQVTVGSTTKSYSYDAQGRKIFESTTVGSTSFKRSYVYDGWNAVTEYDNALNLSRSHVWGLDLSGTLQGAGGVGGLLAVVHEDEVGDPVFYPTYDGNGNVSEYLNSTGSVVAHFEYDPFGRTNVDTDTAKIFPIRFSTKKIDFETGLLYYGYRHYNPFHGRWLSRDPIKELGGVNLYAVIGNDMINHVDYLGLKDKVKDDAGAECCEKDLKDVELQVDMDPLIGHAQLQLPNEGDIAHGFFPAGGSKGIWPSKGEYIRQPHDYTPGKVRTYKACPESVEKLKKSIEDNKDNDYSLTNIGGENCAGWACNRLEDAGFDAPFGGTLPGAQPKDLAPNSELINPF